MVRVQALLFCSQDNYQRAVFLFGRLQSVRRTISKLIFFLVAMSLVPFVCAELPEEWRLSVLTIGIMLELFAGAILYLAHSRWHARHRDYPVPKWMRLVNDEPVLIPRRVPERKRSSFACCSEFRKGVLDGGQCQTAFPRVVH